MGPSVSCLSRPASRVLLVDDDDHVRDVTAMILAGLGHTVRATRNGREAFRWLEEEPCDLLMLDLKMPEIDGPTLYAEVLARWPTGGPRVLFFSGFAEAPLYEAALGPFKTGTPLQLEFIKPAGRRLHVSGVVSAKGSMDRGFRS
jgi:CheY-like chemotaxis protein